MQVEVSRPHRNRIDVEVAYENRRLATEASCVEGYAGKFGRRLRVRQPIAVCSGRIEEKEEARKLKAAGIPLWAKA